MEDIIEFVLETILEGAAEVSQSKRVPMPIRIILATIIILLYLALLGVLIYVGVKNRSIILTVVVSVLAVAFILYVLKKIDKMREEK